MNEATRLLFEQFGIALGLGLLVGLQRQFAESPLAGLRTFPLVAVLGTLCAHLDLQLQSHGWVTAAGFVAAGALIGIGKFTVTRQPHADLGLTTEIALLLTFALGAYLAFGDRVLAVALGGGMAVLLQFKPELHGLVARLSAADLRAIMRFVLITCIVLPLLPNKTYGPFDVINPFEIWLLVVVIVGVGLLGYIAYRFLGAGAGVLITGLLGGAISSTATTWSYARQRTANPEADRIAVAVIVIASAVAYVRVLLIVSVAAPGILPAVAAPVVSVLAVMTLSAAGAWWNARAHADDLPEQSNPTELKSALTFGVVYSGILLLLAAARRQVGAASLYLVAVLAGFTDLDAITISTARLASAAGPSPIAVDVAWRMMLAATLSNLCFKSALLAFSGRRRLCRDVVAYFAAPVLLTLAVIFFWPAT